jgi:phosphohistidine phosphatase
MSTSLYVLRHAIAVERGTADHADDSLRPLSEDGRAKMRRMAAGMEAMKLSFDLVFSSPYLRARQTAEIVTRQFGIEHLLRMTGHLEPAGNPERLMHEIADAGSSSQNLLIVGHEPYLSDLISVLLTGDARLQLALKKGGLCRLTIDRPRYARCAILDWLLTPAHLRKLAG